MSDLVNDVIGDILLRLPVKSLLLFRCVCKTWRALIDTNYFVKQHLNHSTQTHSKRKLILESYNLHYLGLYSLKDHPLTLVHPSNPYRLVTTLLGSCNGLLCIRHTELIIIWNPATQKHVKLPPSKSSLVKRDRMVKSCILSHGFGYDPVSDDYKMVILIQIFLTEDNSFRTETKVYSLRSGLWRIVEDFPDYIIVSKKTRLTCGALHWIAAKHEFNPACFVAAFDLVTEKHMIMTLPHLPEYKVPYKVPCLSVSELDGCLSIACGYVKVIFVDVWMMKDYGVKESWTKLLTLSDSNIIRIIDYVVPLAYSKNGDEVLLMVNSTNLMWYNLENRTIKFITVCGLREFFYAANWLESLVSLGKKAENDKKQGGEKGAKRQRKE